MAKDILNECGSGKYVFTMYCKMGAIEFNGKLRKFNLSALCIMVERGIFCIEDHIELRP